jgi:hypothetical protein
VDPSGLGSAPVLSFLMDLRDIVVIVWGILSIILLLTLALVVFILTLSVKRLIAEVNDLLNSGVKPVLASARESADNVAGTTRFIGDKAVAPIIRVIGLIAGVRRGMAVFGSLTGHGKDREARS